MNRNRILLLLLALIAIMTLAFAGCGGGDNGGEGGGETPEPEYTLTLDKNSLMMTLGDEFTPLNATYDLQDGATLSFTSSDPTVVAVDEYGRLSALRVGTAVITVSYAKLTATCDVEVSLNNLLPVLQLTNLADTQVLIDRDTQLDLSAEVVFNNKTFTDVTLNYEVADDTIGAVENGIFTPIARGTTEITISAEWRGVSDIPSLRKTVAVEIVGVKNVSVNGGINEITLRTESDLESDFIIVAEYDGEPLTTAVTVTEGSEYIDYDADNHKVVSKGTVGEAKITVAYEIDGEAEELEISVHVIRTMYNYADTVENFSAIHGDFASGITLANILGTDITEAYDAEGNELTVVNNKVYGLTMSSEGETETSITIASATRGYVVNIKGYGGIISSTADLALFDINANYTSDPNNEGHKTWLPIDSTKPIATWEGYYILSDDIDASSYTHVTHATNLQQRGIATAPAPFCGFHGTLDGQGHTIYGLTVGAYGLFGYLVDATVKNIAFQSVTLIDVNFSTLLGTWAIGTTVSNVYVSIANRDTLANGGAVFTGGVHSCSVSNCIVETKPRFAYSTTNKAGVYASFLYRNDQLFKNQEIKSTFSDVYVISCEKIGYYKAAKCYLIAENEEFTPPESDFTAFTLTGVKKYDTVAAFKAAENTFDFAEEYWDMVDGIPVWKTLFETGTPDDNGFGSFDVDWL